MYFDVEQSTGKVSVKNQTLLDREVRSLYSATLQARDTDDKPGSTQLEITLTDINDQPPVFNRKSYLDFVKEGGTLNLQIEVSMCRSWLADLLNHICILALSHHSRYQFYFGKLVASFASYNLSFIICSYLILALFVLRYLGSSMAI